MKFKKMAAALLVASSLAFPCMSYAQSGAQVQPTAKNDTTTVILNGPNVTAPNVTAVQSNTTSDTIQIQLNGKNITFTDAQPVIEAGHVYVPFRTVFEALNSQVDYDEPTGAITAKRGDKTISLKSGSSEISVDDNGKGSKFKVGNPVFVKSGRTYVPVRTIAEAFGCRVGWDSNNKTAIVVDKDLYSNGLSGSYTYADKLFSFLSDVNAKDKAIDCKLNLLTGFKNEDGTDASVSINMKITGSQTKDATQIDIAISSTGNNIDKLMDDIGEENQDIVNALKSSNITLVLDSKNSVFYAKGELISALLKVPDDTWVTLSKDDLESLGFMGGEGLSYLFSPVSQTSFKNTIDTTLDIVPINDVVTSKAIFDALDSELTLYKDSSFKKTANGYTSTSKSNIAEGSTTTNTLNINTDNKDSVTGYSINSDTDLSGISTVNANITCTADSATATMTMDVPNTINLKLDLTANYTYGEQPAVTIPSGNTVSLKDKLSSLFN
jgi:hypothetical protein